jgi:O-antigen ligase
MASALKSLIVLVLLWFAAYWLVGKAFFAHEKDQEIFKTLRTCSLGVIALAFLSQNFWVYAVLGCFLVAKIRDKVNPAAIVASTFFCVPFYQRVIYLPGADSTVAFVSLQHMIIWLLIFWLPLKNEKGKGLGYFDTWTDKFLAGWVLYQAIIFFAASTIPHAIKTVVSEATLSYLLYFLISRSIKSRDDLALVVKALALQVLFLALVGSFESVRHWLLYTPVETVLGISDVPLARYLERDNIGLLRSLASAGHPIILAAILSSGVLLWVGLLDEPGLSRRWVWICWGVVVLGLISTFSRGPWLATIAGYAIFVLASKDLFKQIFRFSLVAAVLVGLLFVLPGGEKIIDMLPFVGKSESGSVDYRTLLVQVCLILFWENPWFGSTDYMSEPIMQSLVQGQGIIDMVNTYLSIAMSGGFVGLAIYVGIFLSALIPLGRMIRKTDYKIHRAIFAGLICVMIILATVSNITSLPLLCWMLLGLAKASTWVIQKEAQVG